MHKVLSDRRTIFTLVAPGLLFVTLLIFVPILYGINYSLTDWKGIGDYNYIGFDNYVAIFKGDSIFWKSLLNSLLLGLALIVIQHPFSILMAMLVQYTGRFEKLLRICIFIPGIISGFVTTKMWISILDTQFGMLNRVLDMVHLSNWKQDWLADPTWAMISIIFVCMWQGFGYSFLLYFAGVKGVSKDLHEAAMLDGATEFKFNTRIVLPLLMPVIRVNLVLAVVSAFKQMETVFLMTGGGPANSTQFMSTYLYSKAFQESLYGYGNAISIMLVGICLLVTLLLNRIMNRETGE
jgi:raffinose/stachyose/melibiose transport system permease protein